MNNQGSLNYLLTGSGILALALVPSGPFPARAFAFETPTNPAIHDSTGNELHRSSTLDYSVANPRAEHWPEIGTSLSPRHVTAERSVRARPNAGRALVIWTVTSPGDSGPGTLRDALASAQDGDTIVFYPVTFPPTRPKIIALQSALPSIAKNNLTIDTHNAGVILDGSRITAPQTNGITINGADGVTIKGLQISGFPDDGIDIREGAQNITIGGDRDAGKVTSQISFICIAKLPASDRSKSPTILSVVCWTHPALGYFHPQQSLCERMNTNLKGHKDDPRKAGPL